MSTPVTAHGPMPAINWEAENPVLGQFELGIETDGQRRVWIGDGVTNVLQLPPLSPVMASYLENDITYNDNATLAATALSITIPQRNDYINTHYRVELDLFSTNVTKALKLDFYLDNGNEFSGWNGYWSASLVGVATDVGIGDAVDTVYAPSTGFDASIAPYIYYKYRGSFELTAGDDAGLFSLRAAQRTAHASDTIILQGSTLVVTRLN